MRRETADQRGSGSRALHTVVPLALAIVFGLASDAWPLFDFARCGNERINVAHREECDGTKLGGATCESLGFTGGELACSAECQYDTSGCTGAGDRFVDTGLTVIDNETGLEWEKKNDDPDTVRYFGNSYFWTNTFTNFLLELNNCASEDGQSVSPGFAGHCDWRIPQIDELRTILDTSAGACGGGSGACIDPIFGLTAAVDYWSASSVAGDVSDAWVVSFGDGAVEVESKTFPENVRAVRDVSP